MRVAHCLILVKLLLAPVTSRDKYREAARLWTSTYVKIAINQRLDLNVAGPNP